MYSAKMLAAWSIFSFPVVLVAYERGTDIQQAATDDSIPEIPSYPSETRYQLGDEIARGGMGSILWARDSLLDREVAQIGIVAVAQPFSSLLTANAVQSECW